MQGSTELLAASGAAGEQQQSVIVQLHRQLAEISAEHTAAIAAAKAAAQDRRVDGAQSTDQPAPHTATALPRLMRPALVGCAALLATADAGTRPTPTEPAQHEAPLVARAHVSDRISQDTAQLASQLPGVTATGVQSASDGMGGLRTDNGRAAGHCTPLPVLPLRPTGYLQPAQPLQMEHVLPDACVQPDACAFDTQPTAGNSENAQQKGAVTNAARPLAQAEQQPDCTGLPTAADALLPQSRGNEQCGVFVPSAIRCGLAPPNSSSERVMTDASNDGPRITEMRKRPKVTACGASADGSAGNEQGPTGNRSVVEMFASLHHVQDGVDSDSPPESALLQQARARDAELEPAWKKRRADVM